jgi:hypothetical protein
MGLTQIIRRYEQQLEPGELNADQRRADQPM